MISPFSRAVARIFAVSLSELHSGHGADDPHVADELVLFRPAMHALLDHRTDAGGPLGQLLVAHDVHHRETRSAGDRVSPVRTTQASRVGRVHHLGAADDARQREARRQAFRHGDEVGLDA
jgi:ParB family chromosome partitioning protein